MSFRIAFYTSVPAGYKGLYNRLIRWWTQSEVSHVELVFSDGKMGSSSWMDGGVRLKDALPTPGHWRIYELPAAMEAPAREWFEEHLGEPYDLFGQLLFVLGPVRESRGRSWCSEACGAALNWVEAWRFSPAHQEAIIRSIYVA